MTTGLPKVGELLRDGGHEWVVVAITKDDHGQTAVILDEHFAAPPQADA